MNVMFGIEPNFRQPNSGLRGRNGIIPRAVPWADLQCSVGAKDLLLDSLDIRPCVCVPNAATI